MASAVVSPRVLPVSRVCTNEIRSTFASMPSAIRVR